MTQLTIIGNLTADPELRFTAQGKPVANFTVAVSKRVKGSDGTWTDGPSSFFRCSLWDAAAENMTESLTKGMRVIVVGEIAQRSFESNGEKRSVFEVSASEVGPSLKWATARVEKSAGTKPKKQPADDPWGSAPVADDSDVPF